MRPPIVFDGVSKKFRRGEHHDSLRDFVPSVARRLWRRGVPPELGAEEFWAVRDVSFEVGEGDALAVIGPNGAGKSTILKLLTRILRPNRGHCEVRGRIGALIEVAAGFHPDLTGRENVFLQGAILGMKRAEIASKFDRIVDFSGISEFIDTPVKRFSSGMNARLGFAIAANLDPDVLIIDEVLSVGDSGFQQRCVDRMRELIARGVPLVFVSHNLPAVAELCTRAILVKRGQVVHAGAPAETIQQYRQAVAARPSGDERPASDIWISSVQLLDRTDASSDLFRTGDPITIRVGYETKVPVDRPGFGVDVHRDGIYCFGINTRMDGHDLGTLAGSGFVDLSLDSLQLSAGCYTASIAIHRSGGIGSSGGLGVYDHHELAYPFTITSDRDGLGLLSPPHSWPHQPDVRRGTAGPSHVRLFSKPGAARAASTGKEFAVR